MSSTGTCHNYDIDLSPYLVFYIKLLNCSNKNHFFYYKVWFWVASCKGVFVQFAWLSSTIVQFLGPLFVLLNLCAHLCRPNVYRYNFSVGAGYSLDKGDNIYLPCSDLNSQPSWLSTSCLFSVHRIRIRTDPQKGMPPGSGSGSGSMR